MKPDTWIVERCTGDEPMIEPFERGIVRETNGVGAISWGLSSYGYDIRCGTEFKIFTNVNAAEVDPKALDDAAFVTVTAKEGEFIRIPPNSFALAHSLEYLRIPRDVVALSTPKSTYARCFTGSTRVATLDGENPSFAEMIASPRRRWGIGWTGSEMCATELLAPRVIEKDAELVRVTLDSGETIDCTPDHEFLLRQGGTCAARNLFPGASLMPLYLRTNKRGYTQVYDPSKARDRQLLYWLADVWNIRHGVYAAGVREHRHHIDHDKTNNNPTNIIRMDEDEHNLLHSTPERAAAAGVALRAKLAVIRKDPELWAAFCERQRANSLQKPPAARQAQAQRLVAFACGPEGKAAISAGLTAFYASPAGGLARAERSDSRRRRHANMTKEEHVSWGDKRKFPVTGDAVLSALRRYGSRVKACAALGCSTTVLKRFSAEVKLWVQERREAKRTNHKVISVETLKQREDVYCLTSEECGNFALASGVFVKNCGLIVPTTVLEPGWCGTLTIEISNTSPLPGRVYAGEGITQLLFSGSDIAYESQDGKTTAEWLRTIYPTTCEVSYADRKGKYQGQRGITLPRA